MRYEPLLVGLALVLGGCGASASATVSSSRMPVNSKAMASLPALPDQRPADFRISLSNEGPKISNITCEPTECVLTQLTKTDTVATHKPVTPAQLDAVYKVVHDETFDKLKVEASPIPDDAEVATLWVRVNGIHYGVVPQGKQDIAKADSAHFAAVRGALEALSTELSIGPNTPLPPPPGVSQPGAKPGPARPAPLPAKPGAPPPAPPPPPAAAP